MTVEKENFDFLKRAYEREKRAKQEAERIIEEKSTELFFINKELEQFNNSLEQKVTERTKQLQEEQQKAERLANIKQQFLANMSHEIRTPMNAIIGFTHLLLKSELNEKKLKYLKAIEKSSKNLLVIINDILDISKIEEGKMQIESIDVDLKVLIETVLSSFQESTNKPLLSIESCIDPRIRYVKSDQVRLNQIFTNLISNAIKFTDQGEVLFKAELISDNEYRQQIKFTVRDTGIGIDKDKISSVFDSFSQADQSITRKYGGTGLGLTITKQLVTLLGGLISVDSEKGVGTTFEVTLPFEKGEVKKNKLTKNKMEIDQIKHLRILIAEDNDFNQFLIESILDEWGIHFHIVSNGAKAIESIREDEYDLILMDIQMPEMSGLDATRIIRSEMKLNIPIIALTANAMEEDRLRYLKEGMNGYISKPFREEDLFYAIIKVLNINNSGNKTSLNLTYINDTCRNDPDFIRTMLSKIAANLHDKVLNNFIFKTTLNETTLSHVRASLHDIKSSVILLDETELMNLINQLNDPDIEMKDAEIKFEMLKEKVALLNEKIDTHMKFLKFGNILS